MEATVLSSPQEGLIALPDFKPLADVGACPVYTDYYTARIGMYSPYDQEFVYLSIPIPEYSKYYQ